MPVKSNKKKIAKKVVSDSDSDDEYYLPSDLNYVSEGGSVDSNSITVPKYIPLVINIPTNIQNIFDNKGDISFSSNIDYPKFSLGFHHFIHSAKNTMSILKQFENKKKVYLVMNEFERNVDNYEESIGNISKVYFNIDKDKKPDILSRDFYKLWELLFMFDIVNIDKDSFVSAHLAEGPGSFIQAVMFFRDMFCKKGLSSKDKYYAVTLHNENEGDSTREIDKKFIEYYESEKPQRIHIHKTYNKQSAGGVQTKDNGDITDPKTVKLFGGEMKEKADFITGDGSFDWINENIQEQEAFRLIFSQIVAAVKYQKKGGAFVCKFFEMFTSVSLKFVSILASLYSKVFIAKPLMSRESTSERYVVCTQFKYSDSDKEYKSIVKQLDEMLEKSHKNKSLKLNDLFSDYDIKDELKNHIIEINTSIANKQMKSITEIVSFINAQNYYGDLYQDKRDKQIEASKYWISLFFPDPKDYKETKTKIVDISFISNKMNVDNAIELGKTLL